ncbi:unnamed protein product [Musa textilis]
MTQGSGDGVVTNLCGGLHPISSLSPCIIKRCTTIGRYANPRSSSGFTTHSSSQLLLTHSSWNLK